MTCMQFFTKDEIRDKHKGKIAEILSTHKHEEAVEALTNYLMRRIGNVLASERIKAKKRELRLMAERRQKHERGAFQ